MEKFRDIEVGEVFFYGEIYYRKRSKSEGEILSDTKYEEGRAKFMPFFGGRCTFAKDKSVVRVESKLLMEETLENSPNNNPTRKDWPVGQAPG